MRNLGITGFARDGFVRSPAIPPNSIVWSGNLCKSLSRPQSALKPPKGKPSIAANPPGIPTEFILSAIPNPLNSTEFPWIFPNFPDFARIPVNPLKLFWKSGEKNSRKWPAWNTFPDFQQAGFGQARPSGGKASSDKHLQRYLFCTHVLLSPHKWMCEPHSACDCRASRPLRGARYYGGNEFIDMAEKICQDRALDAYSLNPDEWGVNVQATMG